MLAAFFYQGEVPESTTAMDNAIECLVAESKGDLDDAACRSIVDGLVKVWKALREHERHAGGDEDYVERCFESFEHGERAFRDVFMGVYTVTVRRDFPDYDPSDDGVAWWPSGMNPDGRWPKAFVLKAAKILGEIEGVKSSQMYKYMQRMDEKKAKEATA